MLRARKILCQSVAAGLAIGLGSWTPAATIRYDLRFADGSHVKTATPGSTYPIEAWAIVSGTNGTTIDEGLSISALVIASTQTGGGAITSGGLSNGLIEAPFNGPSARNGQANNTTDDGIVDWGAPVLGTFADPKWMSAWAQTTIFGGGTVGQAVDANSWEFKIATFSLNATTVGAGKTQFNFINGTSPSPIPGVGSTYCVGRTDGVGFGIFTSNPGDTFTQSQGITLVPEATGLGIFASVSIGLLVRVEREPKKK